MRRLGYLLAPVLVAAALAPSTAAAAPSPIHYSISTKAQFVTPFTILLPVTVTCQPTGTFEFSVNVFEPSTGGSGGTGDVGSCTGSAQTENVPISPGPWFPGNAYATGRACEPADGSGVCVTDQRQIQITN